jgi:hypothetical protein
MASKLVARSSVVIAAFWNTGFAMAGDSTDAMSKRQSDHEWRWSRQGVEQRIGGMSPADALLTVELFNARHADDVSKHLDAGAFLSGLSAREAHEVRERVAALRQSATGWGQEYWAERLREARTGIKDSGHDQGDHDIDGCCSSGLPCRDAAGGLLRRTHAGALMMDADLSCTRNPA